MGKRSNFPRVPRDFYPTPFEAVPPLVPHLRGVASGLPPGATTRTGRTPANKGE